MVYACQSSDVRTPQCACPLPPPGLCLGAAVVQLRSADSWQRYPYLTGQSCDPLTGNCHSLSRWLESCAGVPGFAQQRYSLSVGFLKERVGAPPSTNTRQCHPPRAEPPPCGDCLYPISGGRKQSPDRLGHPQRRMHSSEVPRMFE